MTGKGPIQLNAETVRRLTPFPALIDALHKGFAGVDGQTVSPLRHVHALGPEQRLLLMPAWHPGGLAGVKLLMVDGARRPSIAGTYLLLDPESGSTLALLDGPMLTARRTAATSALAARLLARPDAATLLLLGTGSLALHLVEAHAAVRPIRRVLCWGRSPAQAARIAAEVQATGLEATGVPTPAAGLAEADIVCAATASTTALIAGSDLRAGTHVDLVGSYRRDMLEADADAMRRSRVFVDTREGALGEAGEILQAIAEGAMRESDILADLAQLCRGDVSGRRTAGEITLFKAVGSGSADLAAAEHVWTASAHA